MPYFEIAMVKLDVAALGLKKAPSIAGIPYDRPTAELRSQLAHAIRALSAESKHPIHLLQDLQDMSTLFYIGKWNTIAAYQDYFEGPLQKELTDRLAVLYGKVVGRGLYIFHETGVGGRALPFPFHSTKALMKASVVGIAKHHVEGENCGDFKARLHGWKERTEHTSKHHVAAGSRIPLAINGDPPAGEEKFKELVVLTGWDSMEQYRNIPTVLDDESLHKVCPECVDRHITQIIVLE